MSKRVAIVQSNYLPWKGYFDLIASVDEFVLLDDVQYTRRDWRNRNKIKTAQGALWLTIPVQVKGKHLQAIKDAEISEPGWNEQHLRTLQMSYAKARHYPAQRAWLEDLYARATFSRLSEINHHFLTAICSRLGITTEITWSMDYGVVDGKTERLVDLCRKAGATHYLSGPMARDYIVPELFAEAGIALAFMDYGGYPEYPQIHPPFDHYVSVLDLILNTGPAAAGFMKAATGKADPAARQSA